MTRLRALAASVLLAAFFAAAQGAAHAVKTGSTPPDGAVLSRTPAEIGMDFDTPIRITMARLTGADGVEARLERSDGMRPTTRFRATPVELAPGIWRLEWRGLAEDGHVMQGAFGFEIRD
ncbi:MAG: copper resistance CopC family protein [Pseudomonadota bacterium]